MKVNNNDLAIQRTKLANQRTYLAYMRTGFGIASIAGAFKKLWIALFGLVMVVVSTIQYLYVNDNLGQKQDPNNKTLDMVPAIYLPLSIGALYLQMNK